MTIEDVGRAQKFRIKVLMAMYEKAQGLINYTFRSTSDINCLLASEEYSDDQFFSALIFLYQEDYISYLDASRDSDLFMILDINLTSKGVRMVETIITDGNVDQFSNDFSPKIIQQIIIQNNDNSNIQVSKIGGMV